MPVFDFSNSPSDKKEAICTYETFASNESVATEENPILVLDNSNKKWPHHSVGKFTNPIKRTSFEFNEEDGTVSADILKIDLRFVSLLQWLGENHINVRLSGVNREDGYAVYKIREIAFGGGTKLSAEDGFLQFMIERLLSSHAPLEEAVDEELEEMGDSMKLTSIQSITDFMNCAGRTLPDNIRLWARRNLAVARSNEVSPEEKRHAQRALSIMMNIKWKNNYFKAIDPNEARRTGGGITLEHANKVGVSHVVKRGDQHADNAGHSKLADQAADRRLCHPLVLQFHFIHRRSPEFVFLYYTTVNFKNL